MVLLRHTLPDASWHYDWMIRPEPGARLLTFRVRVRIDDANLDAFDAEQIAAHRDAYLDYEGPLSHGRGRVKRIARGRAHLRERSEKTLEALVRWEGGSARLWRGSALSRRPGWWRFVRAV
jgi:hypothetical protein